MNYFNSGNVTIEDLKQFLLARKIQPSIHRIKILEYLSKNFVHPTADVIYQALNDEIPTLSKTTVYNTLKLFLEHGIVIDLTIDGTEVRYDINTTPHSHFKCVKCGAIYDIEIPESIKKPEEIDGHKISGMQIYTYGICKKCREV